MNTIILGDVKNNLQSFQEYGVAGPEQKKYEKLAREFKYLMDTVDTQLLILRSMADLSEEAGNLQLAEFLHNLRSKMDTELTLLSDSKHACNNIADN